MTGYPAADWRDPQAYDRLLISARPRFAWEWLRRAVGYRAAWSAGDAFLAPRFKLCRLEDPDKSLEARPLWLADAMPSALQADAVPACGSGHFDLGRLQSLVTIHADSGGVHLLLSDGFQDIRLDILQGDPRAGPVHLRWRLHGIEALGTPLRSLRAFAAIAANGRMPRLVPERRARRWATILQVHDALAAGASQREIALALYGRLITQPCWRINAPEIRSRVQRLVATVRLMQGGGWTDFLQS